MRSPCMPMPFPSPSHSSSPCLSPSPSPSPCLFPTPWPQLVHGLGRQDVLPAPTWCLWFAPGTWTVQPQQNALNPPYVEQMRGVSQLREPLWWLYSPPLTPKDADPVEDLRESIQAGAENREPWGAAGARQQPLCPMQAAAPHACSGEPPSPCAA